MGRAEDLFEKIKRDGELAINEFILTRKSEELFLDFKRSADDGLGKVFHDNDRNNLSKAISGFGNSEGGVILWGVDCKREKYDPADIPRTKHPIKDIKKFISFVESAISGCTIPPHSKVQNYPISINKNDEGFVMTYIPKSVHAPHQVVNDFKYYMRAGSSFMPVTHGILAGMFGQRPQPDVFINFPVDPAIINAGSIVVTIIFMICNGGAGIASDIFINLKMISSPGEKCRVLFDTLQPEYWIQNFALGRFLTLISKHELRLPPDSSIEAVRMILSIEPPFDRDFRMDCLCGCGQAPSFKFELKQSQGVIEELYTQFLKKNEESTLTEEDRFNFVQSLLPKERERL
jgi:hypothetical protein